MNRLIQRAISQSSKVQKTVNGKRKYLISYIPDKNEVAILRSFIPVKEESHRKLNREYTPSFDYSTDSLLDYPTIVAAKLGKDEKRDWPSYNNLLSVQVGRCPLNCWHCYLQECLRLSCAECKNQPFCCKQRRKIENIHLKYFSAEELLNSFLAQREIDKAKGIASDIFRITGGEPFLAPQLIIELLNLLEQRGLQTEIFLWTETNIVPFCCDTNGNSVVSEKQLVELSRHKNFSVHPCFHGLSSEEFVAISGAEINWGQLLAGFRRICSTSIDIYPSFGGNVSSLHNIALFMDKLISIDPLLPLKFCVINYDLNYEPIKRRLQIISRINNSEYSIYSFQEAIELWDKMLHNHCGYAYAEIPRHRIQKVAGVYCELPASGSEERTSPGMNSIPEFVPKVGECIHLFKYPSMPEYQEYLLQIIALPCGARGKIIYGSDWVNEGYRDIFNNVLSISFPSAIFWAINKQEKCFDFALPIRYLKLLSIKTMQDQYEIEYIAGKFISGDEEVSSIASLSERINVDIKDLSYIGDRRGFVYIGSDPDFEKMDMPSLQSLYKKLRNAATLSRDKITDYPFVHIFRIGKKQKRHLDAQGIYKLARDRKYEMEISVYQEGKFRCANRTVKVNGHSFKGKLATERLPVSCSDSYNDNSELLPIEVIADDINYTIPLRIRQTFPLRDIAKDMICILLIGIVGIAMMKVCKTEPGLAPAVFSAAVIPAINIVTTISRYWKRRITR